ncbi:MAG: hypothetical protein MZW92_12175 [Comamonadaceae bacterium]|nr:hypothetical protein [Comamonadaceae bacterium]
MRAAARPAAAEREAGRAAAGRAGARELGARRLTLVAPVPGLHAAGHRLHARRGGEPAPSRARCWPAWFDAVITVDPHLHRVAHAGRGGARPRAASRCRRAPLLGRLGGAARARAPLLLGPDEEAAQWVRAAAARRRPEPRACAASSATATARSTSSCPALDLRGPRGGAARRRGQHRPHAGRGGARGCSPRGAATVDVGGHARAVRRRRAGAAARRRRAPGLEHRHACRTRATRVRVAPLLAGALAVLSAPGAPSP